MRLADLPADCLADRPHLFSETRVKVAASDLAFMRQIIAAIETVLKKVDGGGTGPSGVFMGYDFHLTPEGPRLIEINTNAGGGLLAALQAGRDDVLERYVEMFRTESPRPLKTLAIVDDTPTQQYLYPEFLGFQRLFAQAGIEAVIADPADIPLPVDLVYNRLTDFALDWPPHATLRAAWEAGAAITPNPAHHALYADKRRLVTLTDEAQLMDWGVDVDTRRLLIEGIPRTELVRADQAEAFWQRRSALFFKPVAGYGSKGVYRGDKLTKRVFMEILAGAYVAQAFVPPSVVGAGGEKFKVDVRNYAWRGEVQFVAARLYQGQTTNFRTPGGGFAIVEEA